MRNHYVPFLDALVPTLRAYGIDIITHNCEYAGSQYETNYGPALNVAGADKAFAFKNGMKELAHRNGLIASFMAKPFAGMSGSGCHLHISLQAREGGENAFFDPAGENGLSALGASFTEGVLAHAAAMMPLINPTPNCYHRVKPYTFAPSNVSWGVQDRSAMVRIKATGDDRDASRNARRLGGEQPLSARRRGARRGPARRQGEGEAARAVARHDQRGQSGAPAFPQRLDAALDALEADPEMRAMLGEDFIRVFVAVKRQELDRFHSHVTDWEVNEYLELY